MKVEGVTKSISPLTGLAVELGLSELDNINKPLPKLKLDF